MPEGTVVRLYSDFANVALPSGEVVTARFRGRLERVHAADRSPLAVGDRVLVALEGRETIIEERLARRTRLCRAHPHDEHLEQVVAANIDQVLVLASPLLPPLKAGLVDRHLVAAASAGLPAALCLTKCDLVDEEVQDAVLEPWSELPFPTFRIRQDDPAGIEALRKGWLAGKTTVLLGQSGVGKSTLRNVLLEGLQQPSPIAEISESTGRGKHCTTAATFEPLPEGGFLVDTPGVKEFALSGIDAANLKSCFPEFANVACRFNDCRHVEEPDCGVRALVEAGKASESRIISLVSIAATLPARRYR